MRRRINNPENKRKSDREYYHRKKKEDPLFHARKAKKICG